MANINTYLPTFINYLFIITLIIFAYMRTTSLAGVDIEGKDITKGLTQVNLTSDVEMLIARDKTSRFIVVGAVILLFMTIVAYFFLDYDTETGIVSVSNTFRLIFIWGSLFLIVYLLNFIISRVTVSAELFLRIFFITSLCFWAITGTTFLAISLLPALVDIFANTVGYTWITLFSNAKEKMKIIRSRTAPELDFPSEILITKFNLENFNDVFNGLAELNHDPDKIGKRANEIILDFQLNLKEGADSVMKKEDVRETLLQLVRIKNKVGHMVWIYTASFVSMLVTLIAMNQNIINQ
jgi:hypothetical protein